jgi:radical SAM superfamily enzyme YgiQ (UPF0313 family)
MSTEKHPRGCEVTILLTGVFGPYARDDEYGSRAINPMELFQNQVTRLDGPFSLRVFHRSGGPAMIQANIDAPCTLLEFPTREQFIQEISHHRYDIIGISAIVMNFPKVKAMCELIRQHAPDSEIVVGGHVANLPDIEKRIDADHVVKGDGIAWFRTYLGQEGNEPVKHPLIPSSLSPHVLGMRLPAVPGISPAVVYPSVGCPLGCNFCSTSALFGGKGNSVDFYKTGDELFSIMCGIEREMRVRDFFIQDENFLLHRARAMRFLELMEEHDKSWSLYIFASADAIGRYSIDELIRLGVSWIWLGLEGEDSSYGKLKGTDTIELVRTLQSHGIRVLGSTIIGLECHTPETIDSAIDRAVRHNTDFHQFMLFMPLPGTPLYEDYRSKGLLLSEDEFSLADYHGQYRFNYRHPHIHAFKEHDYLLRAFAADRDTNGPAIARMTATMLEGYRRYKDHPDPRVRRRIRWQNRPLKDLMAGMVWAASRYYGKKGNVRVSSLMNTIVKALYDEFGTYTRTAAPIVGRVIMRALRREEKKLSKGLTYEPTVIREQNEAAIKLRKTVRRGKPALKTTPCRWVAPQQ